MRRSVGLTCTLAVALTAFAAPCAVAQKKGGGREEEGKPKGQPNRPKGPRGPKTPRSRPATLVVESKPGGCVVSVDGVAKGTTDATGALTLSVSKGKRLVTVARPGYQPLSTTLDLESSERRVLPVVLSPLPGRLSISVAPADAVIRIGNVGTFRGPSIDREVPSGSYEVQVSKTGYRDTSKTVAVGPSERAYVEFALVEIPQRELLDTAEEAIGRREYERAAEICNDVLARRPNQRRAMQLLGICLFHLRRYSESAGYLSRAVEGGAEVRLDVKHLHASRSRVDFCAGVLVLRSNGVAFQSSSAPDHNFSVPLQGVRNATFQPTNALRLALRVAIPQGRKEKVSEFVFYPLGVRMSGSTPVCHGCDESTYMVHQILQTLRHQ